MKASPIRSYVGVLTIDDPTTVYGVNCKVCHCPFINHIVIDEAEKASKEGPCICGCRTPKFNIKKLMKFASSNRLYRIGQA